MSARLTERADWIESDWRARVVRIFKGPDERWTVGRGVTFTTSGGTMTVGGTVVDAVIPWARSVQVGSQYLIFTDAVTEQPKESDEGSFGVSLSSMYEFAGPNAIRRVRLVPEGQSDRLETSFQAEVVTRLEELTGAR